MPAPTPSAQRATAAQKIAEAQKMQSDADTVNKAISEDEEKKIYQLLAEADDLQKEAERREQIQVRMEKLDKSTGRITDADGGSRVPAEARDLESERRFGFRNLGEFSQSVWKAMDPAVGLRDKRLDFFSAATGMQQKVGSEGGFLVPPTFSQQIWDGLNKDTDNLLSMCDSYTVDGESLTFPANAETSRATGSRWGGIRGFWIAEAGQITSSKPTFRQLKLEPQELAVMVFVTEKLLRNSPTALDQYVSRAAISEINFLVGDAIINGDGVGKPKGIMSSACVVQVSKEASQATGTVLEINLAKMWSRLHVNARKNAVWFINQDVEPILDQLSITVRNQANTDNVGGYQSGIYDRQANTIKGRPVRSIEFCQSLSTSGDIILADMSAYAAGVKGGIDTAISMHLRFDFAEQAFRFMFAVDGQPWLASALTPFKGNNTLSTFVKLETR